MTFNCFVLWEMRLRWTFSVFIIFSSIFAILEHTTVLTDFQGKTKNWKLFKNLFQLIVTASTFSDGCKEYQKFSVLNSCNFTGSELDHLSRHLLVQSQKWKHQVNVSNLFQVNNKDTKVRNAVFIRTVSLLIILNRFHT